MRDVGTASGDADLITRAAFDAMVRVLVDAAIGGEASGAGQLTGVLPAASGALAGQVAGSGTDYDTEVAADNPAAYWPLRTDALDATANGHDLTAVGTITFDGTAAVFDGSSYFTGDTLPADLIGTDLTFEAWVTPVSGESAGAVLAGNSAPTGPTNRMQYALVGGEWEIEGASGPDTVVGDWSAGVEYHAVLTYVAASGAWVFYLNGSAVGSGAQSGLAFAAADDRFSIGQEWDTATASDVVDAGTRIAQAAVYPSVLSAARVSAHYAAGVGPPSAGSGYGGQGYGEEGYGL